jgi:hypothetical protein
MGDGNAILPSMKQTATTLAAAGLIVAACTVLDYEPPDIAIAEKEAAEDAYNDCVLRSVALMDDGKSDPVSIARGVQPSCAALYEKLTQTVVKRATTQKGKDDAWAMYKAGEIRAITDAVLIHRSLKR